MSDVRTHDVTALLIEWRGGDSAAMEKLLPLVHGELRRLAKRQMAGERPEHVLQATALVNEVYLRLVDIRRVQWQDRAHFFAMAARLMRRVLVDFARAAKEPEARRRDPSRDVRPEPAGRERDPEDLIAIDDALRALAAQYERKSQVVELRFFGGLSVEETAEVLKISPETVMRDWKFAKRLVDARAVARPDRTHDSGGGLHSRTPADLDRSGPVPCRAGACARGARRVPEGGVRGR